MNMKNRMPFAALCIMTITVDISVRHSSLSLTVSAFQQPRSSYSVISTRSVTGAHRSPLHYPLHLSSSDNNNMNDGDDDRYDDVPDGEGAELASKFNDYVVKLQKLEDKLLQDDNIDSNSNIGEEQIVPPQKRFTGQQNPSTRFVSSSSFDQSQSLFSADPSPTNTDPKSSMMQNELNLVNNAETTLVLQGILAMVLLSFMLMVGLNGGIDNESERFINNGGDMLMKEGFDVDYDAIRTDGSDTMAQEASKAAAATSGEESVWL